MLQAGNVVGRWCIIDDAILLFGFDEAPHTTYRGTLAPNVIRGIESWDGANMGEFEIIRP